MNSTFRIVGGTPLSGCLTVHKAKKAALPILAAALLNSEPVTLQSLPQISDLGVMSRLLESLGVKATKRADALTLHADTVNPEGVDVTLFDSLRASVLLLGPLLARCGRALIAKSGGCAIGKRPIDLHLFGLEKLGARFEWDEKSGLLSAKAEKGLFGCRIILPYPSVGASENILLAAVLAKGESRLLGFAAEPEVLDLVCFLNRCGAKIATDGAGNYFVQGVKKLHTCTYTPIPDRIEAVTYLAAAAAGGGEVLLNGVQTAHIRQPLDLLEQMGCRILAEKQSVYLSAHRGLSAPISVKTGPYPAFPTDLQAIFAALACFAKGRSDITERVFEARTPHIPLLQQMGANIALRRGMVIVDGGAPLHGGEMQLPDLRAGAAMVIAAMAAEGESLLHGVKWIDRGYEKLEEAFTGCGGVVIRTEEADGSPKVATNVPRRI